MKKNYADMDPIEEIRAIRAELSRRFKTPSALCEYARQRYYDTNPPPSPPRKTRRVSTKAKTNARPALRRRKSEAHAAKE